MANILKDKVLVGHALKNDLDVLMLSHPRTMIRDTARYRPYMRVRFYLFIAYSLMHCSLFTFMFIILTCRYMESMGKFVLVR